MLSQPVLGGQVDWHFRKHWVHFYGLCLSSVHGAETAGSATPKRPFPESYGCPTMGRGAEQCHGDAPTPRQCCGHFEFIIDRL